MTRQQEGQVARLDLSARPRTFTLLSTVALAESAVTEGLRVATVEEWAWTMDQLRGSVPLPRIPRASRPQGLLRQRAPGPPTLDILDGHTSGSADEHGYTLDVVAQQCLRLVAAWHGALGTCGDG